MEGVAYFATLVEKSLRAPGGHQEGEFIKGLKLISLRVIALARREGRGNLSKGLKLISISEALDVTSSLIS